MFGRLFRCLCCSSGVTVVTLLMKGWKLLILGTSLVISNNRCGVILWRWNKENTIVSMKFPLTQMLGYTGRTRYGVVLSITGAIFRQRCDDSDKTYNSVHLCLCRWRSFVIIREASSWITELALDTWIRHHLLYVCWSALEMFGGGVGGFPRMWQRVGEVSKESF